METTPLKFYGTDAIITNIGTGGSGNDKTKPTINKIPKKVITELKKQLADKIQLSDWSARRFRELEEDIISLKETINYVEGIS